MFFDDMGDVMGQESEDRSTFFWRDIRSSINLNVHGVA